MKPKSTELPKQQAQQQQPTIRFRTNVIAPSEGAPGGSRFFEAGAESPYHDISEVPENLQPFVVTEEDESESEESNARYELNTTYRLTSAGRQGRAIHRQVAELEAEAEQASLG